VEKRNRVLGRGARGLGKAKSDLIGVFAAAERALGDRDAQGLGKVKNDLVGAFDVAERVMGALDAVLSPSEEPELSAESERPKKVDARVVRQRSDGTIEVALTEPPARRGR